MAKLFLSSKRVIDFQNACDNLIAIPPFFTLIIQKDAVKVLNYLICSASCIVIQSKGYSRNKARKNPKDVTVKERRVIQIMCSTSFKLLVYDQRRLSISLCL